MNFVFRCDASRKLGIGHVIRCLTLADYIKSHENNNISFAMRRSKLGIEMVRKRYNVFTPGETRFNYSKWLIDIILETESKYLIIDSRDKLLKSDLRLIKKNTKVKVITIDDPEDKRLECDVVLSPPVYQIDLMSWEGFKGKLFKGWEYVLLRDEFRLIHSNSENSIAHILLSMGGTDNKNLTLDFIKIFNKVKLSFKLIIIIGPGYLYKTTLQQELSKVSFPYEVYYDPVSISKIMTRADFSVITFGQTAYELVALGIPGLYIFHTKDHYMSSKVFIDKGLGLSIGYADSFNIENNLILLEKLIYNVDLINDMKNKCLSLKVCDMELIYNTII